MAGASVTMLASALLRHGIDRLREIRADMIRWMKVHEYESLAHLRGSMSQQAVQFPAAYERAQYVRLVGTSRVLP